jgi:CubicO group peptidase (beta-lactamase class C family)
MYELGGEGVATRLTADSVFEIGSVTKTFTALLLADVVSRGEVRLEDPIGLYLPPGVSAPSRGEREITLLDLVTHTSRLPRVPRRILWRFWDLENPYAGFGVDDLHAEIARARVKRSIGRRFRYSNLGFGLLGYLLSRAAGQDYEGLVRERICVPLGLSSTAVTIDGDLRSRLVQGHRRGGKPVGTWELSSLAGAGGLRSSAADLLRYVEAHLRPAGTPLEAALEAVQVPHHSLREGKVAIGLAWMIMTKGERSSLIHTGGTGGYSTFAGFDRQANVAAVVLVNSRFSLAFDRACQLFFLRLLEA